MKRRRPGWQGLWIAALARQHALPLLSNDAHFDRVDGVERIAF